MLQSNISNSVVCEANNSSAPAAYHDTNVLEFAISGKTFKGVFRSRLMRYNLYLFLIFKLDNPMPSEFNR